ncbi:hypothetical protein PCANC_28698 [Puccinia coronata f. sp. avenae]|uniref:Uncharacterized protein n=1 Tax=Puccinia coronata f. sp. avenae TaxID=200324 RepID=A0A2N5TIV7_9BASI|nr:hypothetical protein PCANC_28698 [Puccinia coronata f. sp. avenae]
MSTRKTNPGIPVPITDPEAILRAARAEQRRIKRVAAHHTSEAAACRAAWARRQAAASPCTKENTPPPAPLTPITEGASPSPLSFPHRCQQCQHLTSPIPPHPSRFPLTGQTPRHNPWTPPIILPHRREHPYPPLTLWHPHPINLTPKTKGTIF